jgi:hypothetical protein
VQELYDLTFAPDAIWGCCEGYSGGDGFAEFVRSHMVEPQAYYIALPEIGLEQIRRLIQARIQLDSTLLNLPGVSTLGRLARVGADLARFPLAAVDALGIVRQHGPLNTLMAARSVNATLDRIWYIRLFNKLTLNGIVPPDHRYSQAPVDTAHGCVPAGGPDEVMPPEAWYGTPPEDLVSQNQLTLVTVVRPEQAKRLQAVLAVIDLYGRRLAQRGELVGISTIHTVRWALIDGGRRLVLASNYDGPWENYIDEFAELILSGLDAIWGSSYGYPQAGAQDVEALKHFLRCHQAPANVFYTAYPTVTLLNLVDALEMERCAATDQQPQRLPGPEPQPIPVPVPA